MKYTLAGMVICREELASEGVYVYKAWVTYVDGYEEILAGDITFLH